MSGWFAVKRGITSHPLFKGKPDRLAVWMWLLDNAAWKDTTHDVKGKTVDVPRGSVCASERQISEACGVGYQVVRTAIKRLKSEHMVNTNVTHGKNIITLCNYAKYQDVGEADNATLTHGQRNANAQKKQGNKVTREANASLDTQAVEIISQVSSLSQAEAFVAHRRAIKKPMTVNAAEAMVKQLAGHHDADAVLNASIANGWQGVFPEKIKPTFTAITGGQHGPRSSNQERDNALADEILAAARAR